MRTNISNHSCNLGELLKLYYAALLVHYFWSQFIYYMDYVNELNSFCIVIVMLTGLACWAQTGFR